MIAGDADDLLRLWETACSRAGEGRRVDIGSIHYNITLASSKWTDMAEVVSAGDVVRRGGTN